MRSLSFTAAVLLLIVITISTLAQGPPDGYESVLVPIYVDEPIPGDRQSLWTTVLTVANQGDVPVVLDGVRPIPGPCQFECLPEELPPGTTIRASLFASDAYTLGYLIYVETEKLDDVAITLRAQDISRQSQTWGTRIPVTSRKDWYGGVFSFPDVTVGSEFRSLLRLYDTSPETVDAVVVRIYRFDEDNVAPLGSVPDVLLSETTVPLVSPGAGFAARAEVPIPSSAERDRLRVEVEPLSDQPEFWGFVSVTNNETQHITVIGPQ